MLDQTLPADLPATIQLTGFIPARASIDRMLFAAAAGSCPAPDADLHRCKR